MSPKITLLGHTPLPATRDAAEFLLTHPACAPNSSPRWWPQGQPRYRAAVQQQQQQSTQCSPHWHREAEGEKKKTGFWSKSREAEGHGKLASDK